jgi:hypothetical protein
MKFVSNISLNFLRRWTVLRKSRPTPLDKLPILVRNDRIKSSIRFFRLRYAYDDRRFVCEVIIGDFVGEDLKQR